MHRLRGERVRPRPGLSSARRQGLFRLAILVGLVGWLVVLGVKGVFGGSSGSKSPSAGPGTSTSRSASPRARTSSLRLPEPLHGAAAAPTDRGVLVIGGADRGDVSTDRVLLVDPVAGRISAAGRLVQPMHDAAAATVDGRTLVFGGGAATTFDTVQELTAGSTASTVGRLPDPASDLSAVVAGDRAFVAGGYDGRAPLDSILEVDGRGAVTRVGALPTPVRYTALAVLGDRIYAFGGELADGRDTNLIQSYDPVTRRASVVGRLGQSVAHASAITLNGAIYLLGGRRDGVASAQILRFDSQRSVARVGRLPSPVFDAAATVASGVGYLVGGIGPAGTSVDRVVVVRA